MSIVNNKLALITIISIIGLGTFIFVYLALTNSSQNSDASTNAQTITSTPTPTHIATTTTIPTPSATSATGSTYKDGTYTKSVSYRVEGHTENIKVVVSIAGDKVTAVQETHTSADRDSEMYQSAFESAVAKVTVGKKVNEISLSRVAGASFTTAAFMNALNQIKSDAQ